MQARLLELEHSADESIDLDVPRYDGRSEEDTCDGVEDGRCAFFPLGSALR